jgi:Flp pilus assembly protein TadD
VVKLLWLLAPACLLSAAEPSDPARDPLEKAYRFLRSGEYPQAIVYLVEASKLAPQRAAIFKELGYAYLKTGEAKLALTMFEQARALDPADTQIALQLGYAYQAEGQAERAKELFLAVAESSDAQARNGAEQALQHLAVAQTGAARSTEPDDPAYNELSEAYRALAGKDYDAAAELFRRALPLAPQRADIRKDLGYVYLKTGDTEAAREVFEQASTLDAADERIALELAFLCHETQREARALQLFRRLQTSKDPQVRDTARTAFENVDGELSQAIERWSQAAETDPYNRSVQLELAGLLEKRGEPAKAADRYLAAWLIPSDERPFEILLHLAGAREAAGQTEEALGAWLLASRSADVRIAETARDHLPGRFPYAAEFRRALDLDPLNSRLRRDLAYLLLQVNLRDEALREFEQIVSQDSNDLLAAAQLADFYLARNNPAEAVRLLEKAVESPDKDIAGRAEERLRQIREQEARPHRELGEKSLNQSYLQDARRELERAYEINPEDFSIALKLGVVHNLMRQDREAVHWFRIASESPNPEVAEQARQSYSNLQPQFRRVTTSIWSLPMFSTRYRDLFNYSQIKTEFSIDALPVRPYLSLRFSGDVRQKTGGDTPLFLSENALVAAAGLRSQIHPRLVLWAEAGEAFHYLGNRPPGVPRAGPDYRGGLSWFTSRGATLGGREPGRFLETNADAVFVSRFDNNTIGYLQLRPGYRLPGNGALQAQVFWNFNVTADVKRLYWANFVETGPGLRLRVPGVSPPMDLSISFVRGVHLINDFNPRRPNYFDLRVSLWYSAGF